LVLFLYVLLRTKGWKNRFKWVAVVIAAADGITYGLISDNWGAGTLLVFRSCALCALGAVCYFATRGRGLSG
jgi:hypothetical protein